MKAASLRLALQAGLLAVCACSLFAQEPGPGPGIPYKGPGRCYVSNSLGMPLEEIGWYRSDEYDYILIVQKQDEVEKRFLLHSGEEIRRWEIVPGEERVYGGGLIEELHRYDTGGRVEEELRYLDGELNRRTVYHYNGDSLSYTETYDSAGALLYRDSFLLSSSGRLRRVHREAVEQGGEQDLALSAGDGTLAEERYGSSTGRLVNHYDHEGRVAVRELWRDGKLVEREQFHYRPDGAVLESCELEELESGRITLRSYDEEGNLVRSSVEQEGQTIEQTSYLRNSEGQLLETIRRSSEGLERWLYEYDPEGVLSREEYSLRGARQKVILYQGENERIEELYREGKMFMKVYYRGSQKTKEEFIESGRVVRVRELE